MNQPRDPTTNIWTPGRDPPGAPPQERRRKPARNRLALGGIPMLLVSAAVLGSSVALADHVVMPLVSDGGELAYVRDFASDAALRAAAGDRVEGTYVSYAVRPDGSAKDTIVDWSSRGRVADTAIFQAITLPDGALTSALATAVPVQQYDAGLLVHCWGAGRFAAFNGVNAGFAIQAAAGFDVTFLAAQPLDIAETSPSHVTLEHDGHRYVVALLGQGVLQTNGAQLRATLAPGAELRGWIDAEYPVTTQLMHAEFDHLAGAC